MYNNNNNQLKKTNVMKTTERASRSFEYQTAKKTLKWVSLDAKSEYRGDSPAIRMIINDTCDSICKDLHLSDYYRGLLENYACTLHPKN